MRIPEHENEYMLFSWLTTQMPAVIMLFKKAGVAQLVEYKLPKLGVAGSNPVARSIISR